MNFTYPDIPFTQDRKMYDYLFQIDRLLREFGAAISELNVTSNNLTKEINSLRTA